MISELTASEGTLNFYNEKMSIDANILLEGLVQNEASVLDSAVQKQKSKKKVYTTRNTAKEADEIPSKIPIISIAPWCEAISFQVNDYAYLRLKDDNMEIPDLQTLRLIYGIFLKKYEEASYRKVEDQIQYSNENEWLQKRITIYIKDFIEMTGRCRNVGNENIEWIVKKIRDYSNLTGVVNEMGVGCSIANEQPVIDHFDYDESDKTIALSSPYIMFLIKQVSNARMKRDRNGKPKRFKSGKLDLKQGYSYHINSSILVEKSIRAVEIIGIITTLIDRAGSHKNLKKDNDQDGDFQRKAANISFWKIIDRSEKLKREYNAITKTSNKNRLLKSTFTKAWELLREKTDIQECYRNIELPDPQNPMYIPTTSTLKSVLRFPHDGKIRKRK